MLVTNPPYSGEHVETWDSCDGGSQITVLFYTFLLCLFVFFQTDVLWRDMERYGEIWRVGSLSTSRQILDFIDVEVGVTDIDPVHATYPAK